MLHRHLNHQAITRAAIDDIIARGKRRSGIDSACRNGATLYGAVKGSSIRTERNLLPMTNQPLGTTTVTQVGLIVSDIETKARTWAGVLGLPVPEIIVTDTLDKAQTEYQGAPTFARAKLAFFHLGQVDLELIEPMGEPSTWKDQLDQHGDSLHHIAFVIQGMPEKLAYLDSKGIPLVQRGEYTGGRYAYVDGMAQLGTVVELLEND